MNISVEQEVAQAIQLLLTEGKTPTVALVKMKLTQFVPLPVIINALQCWKQNGTLNQTSKVPTVISDKERITQLEAQLAALTERVLQLERQASAQG